MDRIIRKIRNRSGETIAETLVALLISSLALVMLAGAIAAASGIITRSSAKINAYYDANQALAEMGPDVNGSGKLTLAKTAPAAGEEDKSPGFSDSNIAVRYGTNDVLNSSKPVIAFRLSGNGTPAPTPPEGD